MLTKTIFVCLGPDNWYVKYPVCGGHFQSPIDIKTDEAVYDEKIRKEPFVFHGYDSIPQDSKLKMYNNGHAGKIL